MRCSRTRVVVQKFEWEEKGGRVVSSSVAFGKSAHLWLRKIQISVGWRNNEENSQIRMKNRGIPVWNLVVIRNQFLLHYYNQQDGNSYRTKTSTS